MDFKIYYKSRISGEVEERVAMRVDEREGVVWLKSGGWLLLEGAYLTKERAKEHKHLWCQGTHSPKPEDEKS